MQKEYNSEENEIEKLELLNEDNKLNKNIAKEKIWIKNFRL